MKSWLRIFALTGFISLLILTGCEKSGPLADAPLPDTIRVYSGHANSTVITDRGKIKQIVSYFAGNKKRWRHYWITLPATGIKVDFEKNGSFIAEAYIGPDWAIVKAQETYSTEITKQEHDDLFQLLGIDNSPFSPDFAL